MNADFILTRFSVLTVRKRGDLQAPHKPLLVPYALRRWQHGLSEVSFLELVPPLTDLLRRFDPQRKFDHSYSTQQAERSLLGVSPSNRA